MRGLLVLLAACSPTTARAARTYTAGDTMVPTIAVGQRVGLDTHANAAVRGRVVVFRAPQRPDREYVKRVVGLPGDTLASRGTEIVLNGAPIPSCRIGAFHAVDANGASRSGDLWIEALDGAAWLVFHSTASEPVPSGPWTVPPGEVFVLGDSRENSHDSRFWGGLPVRFVVGSVTGVDAPVLPPGAGALAPDLARCRAAIVK